MAESSLHITCQEVVELVNDYLEGTLAPRQTSLFEEHLNFCDGCVTYVDQMRATVGAIGRLEEDELSDDMRDRLLSAFRGWRGT